jgi:transposase
MTLIKEAEMGIKRRKLAAAAVEAAPAEGELPDRWSAQRKTELVLRLFRGEALDAVSRESQVPAHELESWKRVFLETGARGLKTRAEPEERELTLARAKIGELMMRLELAEHLLRKYRRDRAEALRLRQVRASPGSPGARAIGLRGA